VSKTAVMAAEHQGHYVIKMSGDVRLTLCATIDEYLESMFANDNFCEVIVDLTEVDGLDSTTLGLMAKLALRSRQVSGRVPILFSPNASITRLLHSMGFESIFIIREEQADKDEQLATLPELKVDEQNIRRRVIAAHRTLMGLNEKNQQAFASLVNTLEHA